MTSCSFKDSYHTTYIPADWHLKAMLKTFIHYNVHDTVSMESNKAINKSNIQRPTLTGKQNTVKKTKNSKELQR